MLDMKKNDKCHLKLTVIGNDNKKDIRKRKTTI